MKRLILILLLVVACSSADKVCFENDCFEVEVVSKGEELMRGLMYRTHLDEDKGMLFIFEKSGNYPFWMKNTLIPLDMIWINENMQVVSIIENVPPCEADPCPNYDPKAIAKYVLEVNAGISEEIGLEVGNTAEFKLLL